MSLISNARDLYLDSTADIVVSSGDLVLVAVSADAVSQACSLAVSLFRDEWFLDLDLGVPYYENILVKNPNLSVVKSLFLKQLRGVSGVSSVDEIELSFSAQERTLTVSFEATGDLGQITGSLTI